MNDTIYRQDAVEAVCKGCIEEFKTCAHHWSCLKLNNINALPSADRPQGEWIPMRVSSGRDSWKCSICGRRARGKLENIPYCHCGARMRPRLQGKHFDSIIIDESAMKGEDDENV